MKAEADAERWKRARELVAAFLMGFAALATSRIGYQASRWAGEQSTSSTEGPMLRMKSNRASGEAVAGESHRQSAIKDKYVSTVVLLATSLFFSGMSRQFARPGVQAAMLSLLCLAGLFGILSLPVLF